MTPSRSPSPSTPSHALRAVGFVDQAARVERTLGWILWLALGIVLGLNLLPA